VGTGADIDADPLHPHGHSDHDTGADRSTDCDAGCNSDTQRYVRIRVITVNRFLPG
jgi:hypothetical protein